MPAMPADRASHRSTSRPEVEAHGRSPSLCCGDGLRRAGDVITQRLPAATCLPCIAIGQRESLRALVMSAKSRRPSRSRRPARLGWCRGGPRRPWPRTARMAGASDQRTQLRLFLDGELVFGVPWPSRSLWRRQDRVSASRGWGCPSHHAGSVCGASSRWRPGRGCGQITPYEGGHLRLDRVFWTERDTGQRVHPSGLSLLCTSRRQPTVMGAGGA